MVRTLACLLLLLAVPRQQMPNLSQTEISGLPGGGQRFCCPTATADALLWLDKNGVRGLVPDGPNDQARAEALVKELAGYFKTDTGIGTLWDNYFAGLPVFLRNHGYGRSRLTFYGNFAAGQRIGASKQVPNLAGLQRGNTANGFVMLALGYYSLPDQNGACRKTDWHWAVLIDTDPRAGTMTFNDPRPGPAKPKQALTLKIADIPKNSGIALVDPQWPANTQPGDGLKVVLDYPFLPENQRAVLEAALFVNVSK